MLTIWNDSLFRDRGLACFLLDMSPWLIQYHRWASSRFKSSRKKEQHESTREETFLKKSKIQLHYCCCYIMEMPIKRTLEIGVGQKWFVINDTHVVAHDRHEKLLWTWRETRGCSGNDTRGWETRDKCRRFPKESPCLIVHRTLDLPPDSHLHEPPILTPTLRRRSTFSNPNNRDHATFT